METKTLITVCMVTYNAEKWIAQAIESVLAQKYEDFEFLIVNDGSTDKTEQIIKLYDDNRIRYIHYEHRCFAVSANKAISEINTEFLMLIGSDDFLAPDYLAKMVCATAGFPDIDYFYPDHFILVDEKGESPLRDKRWDYLDFSDNRKVEAYLLKYKHSPIPHPGSLIRKSLFDKVGLYDDVKNSEDFVFLCKNALKIRFKRIEDTGDYFYRKLPTSASRGDPVTRNAIHSKALAEMQKSETGKPNLLLCSPWDNCWLRYYQKYFSEKYEVKICKYDRDASQAQTVIEWADIVLFNWSDWFLKYWSNQKKETGKKYIAFLRSYEIWDTNNPWEINWGNVDHLIFVNPLIEQCFLNNAADQIKDFNTPTHFIPNAIDLDEWKFIDRIPNKRISWVNDLSNKKGIQLLVQFAFHMPYDYTVFPAGSQGDLRRSFYFNYITHAMRTNIKIVPIKRYEDVQKFLRGKSYALCTSVVEGHPNALLEAMAVGMKPIIHNFPGSKDLFPEKYIWNTVDEAVKMLEGGYNSAEYRSFVEDKYDMEKIYPQIERLFT